jgi:hypothetical protein
MEEGNSGNWEHFNFSETPQVSENLRGLGW